MDTFPISTPTWSDAAQLFTDVVNQGIDSYLEGFTQSTFSREDGRLKLAFHVDELQILLRRLNEMETDDAEQWAADIVEIHYEVECYN